MVVPNPESPTFVGERFLALAYRTTRAILIARHLLPAGSAFQELPWDTTGRVVPIDPSTPLRDAGAFLNGRPTLPDVRSSPDEIVALAKGHCLVALLLGADPDDPALHWFQEDHFEEFYPTFFEMLAYEAALLKNVGRVLVNRGRTYAFKRLERVFGEPSVFERRDWAALPVNYLREFASNSTEEDRMLMVARLESIADRARRSLDVRLEAQCARALASILGLTFQDDEKKKKELFMLLNKAPERDEALAHLPPLEIPRLNAP